ncbi:TadE/TadG family type IV pilus assembly protein [Acidisphaera sp. S103]|uniref:TadE/TadG family type IV pilus assembly protein n=1 Tax=Acidisphaera sp. S103 TaxID=1747223 RepID=UPI00131E3E40|nr:TadE/TadG family type IV pilus assembly protein [Acidisphaera sp. S103]
MKQIARYSAALNTKAATTVEFALVSIILVTIIFGGMELGLMLWNRGTLQAIAAQTARCAALGTALCSSTTASTTYLISLASTLLEPGLITATNSAQTVVITTSTTCVNDSTGTTSNPITFEVVSITVSPWVGPSLSKLFGPGYRSETITACYPT